jgi:hypothetical protein
MWNSVNIKNRYLLMIPALVLAVCAASAQTSSKKTEVAANGAWASFWRQFTAAVNKKDRVAVRKMMADNFADESGGLNATEWLRFIDENERKGSWRDLQKSFARGTVVNKEWPSKGVPTRITRDKFYYFEFRKDGKWYFAGVVGD